MAQNDNETFKYSSDQTNELANKGRQIIDFFHVPTGHSINFKAFLTQFDDAYASEWNSENVFGRMDPMMTFQRTGRQISIGFDVVAGSVSEAIDNFERASLLIQMLYPSYEVGGGATTIKNSPYFKLQFMNLATNISNQDFSTAEEDGLLGTVNGFSMSPTLDMGFFQDPESFEIFPKVFNLSCTLSVLHQHQLGWIQKSPSDGSFPYLSQGRYDHEKAFVDEFSTLPKTEEQTKSKPNDELDASRANQMTSAREVINARHQANVDPAVAAQTRRRRSAHKKRMADISAGGEWNPPPRGET